MSWVVIVELIYEVVKQRSAAGWPLLMKLLERWKGQLVTLAEGAGDLPAFGAAPSSLKDAVVAFLAGLKDKSGPVLKIVLSLLIASVPEWIDALWDKLFTQGRVPGLAGTYPPVFAGVMPGREDAALAQAVSELPFKVVLDSLLAVDLPVPVVPVDPESATPGLAEPGTPATG